MPYEVKQTAEFEAWLDNVTDPIARNAIIKRIVRISGGLFGDVRSIGDGVSEVRIDVGQGYRAYYTIRGRTVVFMLNGGTKGTQKRDITTARELASGIA